MLHAAEYLFFRDALGDRGKISMDGFQARDACPPSSCTSCGLHRRVGAGAAVLTGHRPASLDGYLIVALLRRRRCDLRPTTVRVEITRQRVEASPRHLDRDRRQRRHQPASGSPGPYVVDVLEFLIAWGEEN